jgi:hypothetical protein
MNRFINSLLITSGFCCGNRKKPLRTATKLMGSIFDELSQSGASITGPMILLITDDGQRIASIGGEQAKLLADGAEFLAQPLINSDAVRDFLVAMQHRAVIAPAQRLPDLG